MKLKIEGMTCAHCVRAVTKALQKLPGATQVDVKLEGGEAVIEGPVDAAAAVQAVKSQGYEAAVA